MSEEEIVELEEAFSYLSNIAFRHAFEETLKAGLSVLISDDGFIYEVFPDGTRTKIKEIEKPFLVKDKIMLLK